MVAITESRFARLLGGLEAGELADFVADLWAARGWDTRVEGSTVVATGGPDDRTTRFRCVAPGRLRSPTIPPGEADAVVSTRDGRRVRHAAAERDLEFLGPAALRRVASYGVDRAVADRVVATHLGSPLVTERPTGRLEDRLASRGVRNALGIGLLVLLLAGVVLAGAGGAGVPLGVSDGGSQSTGGAESPATTQDLAAAGPTTPSVTPDENVRIYPPGVGPGGVTDADRLATAHGESLVRTTYTLVVVHQGSVDLLFDDRRWAFSRQSVVRAQPTHYWYRFAGVEVALNGTSRDVVFEDYADGSFDYRRISGTDAPTYCRGIIPTGGGNGLFSAVGAAYVRRYLATDGGHVEVVTRDAQRRYRVVATGTPERIQGTVYDYEAVAIVDGVGRVHRLSVTYLRPGLGIGSSPTAGGPPDTGLPTDVVRFELLYRQIGATTVPEPAWYPAARNATNETAIDLWPADPRWWSQPIGIDYAEDP